MRQTRHSQTELLLVSLAFPRRFLDLFAVITPTILLASAGASAQASRPQLVFHQEAVHQLPDGFNLAGMGRGAHGELFVWSQAPNRILRFRSGLALDGEWLLPDSITPLVVSSDGDRIEVVSTSPAILYHLDQGGSVKEVISLRRFGTVLGAARGPSGWYLLSFSGAGVLVQLVGDGGYKVAGTYGGLTTEENGRLWLTETRYPFVARELLPDGSVGLAMRPPAAALDSMRVGAGEPDFAAWASLPLVPLKGGYIQTVADLSQDRRLFVVYDSLGAIVSTLRIDAAVGLLLSIAGRERVYGARRTNVVEIITYAYSWGG